MSVPKLITKASSFGVACFPKTCADLFFHVEDASLAATGIEEDPESQGQIGLGLEIFDRLGLPILEKVEVVFGEVGNERAVFIFDVEEELDEFDVNLEGADRLILIFVIGGGIGMLDVRVGIGSGSVRSGGRVLGGGGTREESAG